MADYIYGKYNRGRSEFLYPALRTSTGIKRHGKTVCKFHTPDGTFQLNKGHPRKELLDVLDYDGEL